MVNIVTSKLIIFSPFTHPLKLNLLFSQNAVTLEQFSLRNFWSTKFTINIKILFKVQESNHDEGICSDNKNNIIENGFVERKQSTNSIGHTKSKLKGVTSQ
jgi:hypothetical protein